MASSRLAWAEPTRCGIWPVRLLRPLSRWCTVIGLTPAAWAMAA